MRKRSTSIIVVCLAMAACSENASEPYTLYRNSPFDYSSRVHWATFDAEDRDHYNLNNCLMAARLLNANVTASAKAEGKERDQSAGFWCESGGFEQEGAVPNYFSEAFPTDA